MSDATLRCGLSQEFLSNVIDVVGLEKWQECLDFYDGGPEHVVLELLRYGIDCSKAVEAIRDAMARMR